MSKTNTGSTTEDLIGLWVDAYKTTIGRFAQMPAMGPAREQTEKALKSTSTVVDLYASWLDSTVDLQGICVEAMRRTYEKLDAAKDSDPQALAETDIYKVWTEAFNESLSEFMKSEHFGADQGRLVSQSMDLQTVNREMFDENFLKPMNLPTRSDMDETNKEVYLLKKKVKELSAQIKELSAQIKKPSQKRS